MPIAASLDDWVALAAMSKVAPRWMREVRILWEFWLLPLLIAVLPYRVGLMLARWLAAHLPLYDATAQRAWAVCATVCPGNERVWKSEFRLTQLLDHADLFWSLTRTDAWILARLALPRLDPWPAGGMLAIGFHFGQGLWLLRWLRAAGRPARFLSVRFARSDFETWLHYAYARLRIFAVASAEGAPPIYTGGSRREIGETLAAGGCVFGLVDVALADASRQPANGHLFGHPIAFPEGLLDSAGTVGSPVLIVTACHDRTALRRVDARFFASARALTMSTISAELQQRLDAAPAAWHVWNVWPRFLARA